MTRKMSPSKRRSNLPVQPQAVLGSPTVGTLSPVFPAGRSLNGCDIFRNGFEPLLSNCVRVPFNDLVGLERALHSKSIAAFIVEPIQGKGVNMPIGDYLTTAADLSASTELCLLPIKFRPGWGAPAAFYRGLKPRQHELVVGLITQTYAICPWLGYPRPIGCQIARDIPDCR
jgi:hypothetical protein